MVIEPPSLARRLHEARAAARAIEVSPSEVTSIDAAYAVQSELIALPGNEVAGWKVTALTPADQRKFNADRAVAGALFKNHVHPSGSRLNTSRFVAPIIECEVAFLLGADLPARSEPYSRSDVEEAIAAVLAVFEFPDSRVGKNAGDLLKLADVMNNGALVTGTLVENWRALDLTSIDVRLDRDDELVAEGASARILGDPVLALVALANAYPLPAPLRAGQIATTGTCTDPIAVQPGRYVGYFSTLGEVEVDFTV
jgi:2-keto-4-pentenoate hydratase